MLRIIRLALQELLHSDMAAYRRTVAHFILLPDSTYLGECRLKIVGTMNGLGFARD